MTARDGGRRSWSQNGDGGAFRIDAAFGLTSRCQHHGFRCAR